MKLEREEDAERRIRCRLHKTGPAPSLTLQQPPPNNILRRCSAVETCSINPRELRGCKIKSEVSHRTNLSHCRVLQTLRGWCKIFLFDRTFSKKEDRRFYPFCHNGLPQTTSYKSGLRFFKDFSSTLKCNYLWSFIGKKPHGSLHNGNNRREEEYGSVQLHILK